MLSKKNRTILGLAILIIIVMFSVVGWLIINPSPLIIQGEVEATQISVASKIFGRIDSIFIKEGNTVVKNQSLVSIFSPEISAKYDQATASKRIAGAKKDMAFEGVRKEKIDAAYNIWQTAKAQSDFANKTYTRVSKLFEDGIISAHKMDETEAKRNAALQQSAAAKASYTMALNGARIEDKRAATALFDKANGAVSEVQAYIDETRMKSPINGEIVEIIPKIGELISPGYPIVNIVDLNDIWITFNIREDLLNNFKMNKIFSAKVPALGSSIIEFKITYINALGSFATWTSTKASGDFDLKTFEVKAIPTKIIKDLRPGMSVIVELEK